MSISPAAATVGHNNPPVEVPNTEALVREAHEAVSQAIASKNIDGSAVQLMAHAIMCAHYAEVHGDGKIAPLATIIGSTQATADVRRFMISRLELAPEKVAAPSYDAKAERKDLGTAQRQLLSRALEFAAYLAKCSVPFTAYDAKIGCFLVPRDLLVMRGETPLGSLASTDPVPLNRRSYMVQFLADDGKEGGRNIQASVARFLQVQKPRPTRDSDGPKAGKDFVATLKSLVKIIQDGGDTELNPDDYTDEDMNGMMQVARLLHRVQKAKAAAKDKAAAAPAPAKRSTRKAA